MIKEELIRHGKLDLFENTLGKIIESIIKENCLISCNYKSDKASIEHKENGSIIRIGFAENKSNPIHYIWDILHEYGHLLSGKPIKGVNNTLEREKLAWDIAFKEIKKYPDLLKNIHDFENYREFCLKTYV
jgi:hypothetical protein